MTAIARVDRAGLEAILPLIAGYQRFYGVAEPDDARNREFFARFCPPDSANGALLAAHGDDGAPTGFACLYWTQESVAAADIAVLHDLFVAPEGRGGGTGRALMDAAIAAARERGLPTLSWMTALDNDTAQRLYDTYDVTRGTWYEYSLELG